MSYDFKITDNSGELLRALESQAQVGLEKAGMAMERYAKMGAPVGTPESTGVQGHRGSALKKSITYKVIQRTVYVGTNVKSESINGSGPYPYSVVVEMGSGIYAAEGNGRKSPWTWIDKNGKPHNTRGMKPKHFLKNSIMRHKDEILKALENGIRHG